MFMKTVHSYLRIKWNLDFWNNKFRFIIWFYYVVFDNFEMVLLEKVPSWFFVYQLFRYIEFDIKGEISLPNFARDEKITEIVISKHEMPTGKLFGGKFQKPNTKKCATLKNDREKNINNDVLD